MQCKWAGHVSEEVYVSNGTRQGQNSSTLLFNIYLDQLLLKLKEEGIGCHLGNDYVGSFSYADDVFLNSPTTTGLSCMLSTCESFSAEYNMTFNESKTVCIAFSKETIDCDAKVTLNNKPLKWCKTVKHLGNKVNHNLSDELDIDLKVGSFIGSVNKIIAKVPYASYVTKCKLFSSYCTSFYGSQCWDLSDRHINKLVTTWNKCVRRLLNIPQRTHCALLPRLIGLNPIQFDIENRFFKYVKQWLCSHNTIVQYIITRSMHGFHGILGRSIKHIVNKYNCNLKSFSDCDRLLNISGQNVDSSQVQKVEQIKELLQCKLSGFNDSEQYDIISYLCTE